MSVFNQTEAGTDTEALTDRAPFFAEANALELEYQRASDERNRLSAELAGLPTLRTEAILAGDAQAYAAVEARQRELPALHTMAEITEAQARVRFAVATKEATVAYAEACATLAYEVGGMNGYQRGSAVAKRAEMELESARGNRQAAGSTLRNAYERLDDVMGRAKTASR